jgi:hypothetical protein
LDAYNLINPDVQSHFSSCEFLEIVVANVRIMPFSSDIRIVLKIKIPAICRVIKFFPPALNCSSRKSNAGRLLVAGSYKTTTSAVVAAAQQKPSLPITLMIDCLRKKIIFHVVM